MTHSVSILASRDLGDSVRRSIQRIVRGIATPLIWVVAFILIGLPLGLVLVQAFIPGLFNIEGPDLSPSLDALVRLGSTPRLARGIVDTLLLGVAGAVLSTTVGTLLAALLTLTDVKVRRAWVAMTWIVFAMPSYFKGLAWVLLMSPGGYLVQAGLLSSVGVRIFFGPLGLLFVLIFSLFPIPFFIASARIEGLGGEFLDAARMASARPLRIVLRIVLPMLWPAIVLALLTTFAEVVGDFGLATTIARSMNFGLITYNIYAATASFPVDFPAAGAQALVLVVLVTGSVLAAGTLSSERGTTFLTGRNRSLARFSLGAWQTPMLLGMFGLALGSLLLPLGAIVIRAVTKSLGGGLTTANLSLDAVVGVLDLSTKAGQALAWTLVYALLTAVLAVGFGLLFAYRVSLAGRGIRLATSGVALVTVAIPGVVLAFGYILLYDRLPAFRDLPLYGSRGLLVIGYVAAALPYCLLFTWSALGRLGSSLHEASRLAGASPLRHLVRIVLPLVSGAMVIAFGVTLIRSLFELPMSQFLLPEAGPAVPVVIVDDFTQGRDAIACALALFTLCVVGLVVGMARIARPSLFAAPGGSAG